MKELKSIIGLLVLIVGGFVLYKVVPAFWGNFKLQQLLESQALVYTYTSKSPEEIATAVAAKAQEINVPLTPDQIKVKRGPGEMAITAEYTVHVEMPIHPMDLNFSTATKNKDVMK